MDTHSLLQDTHIHTNVHTPDRQVQSLFQSAKNNSFKTLIFPFMYLKKKDFSGSIQVAWGERGVDKLRRRKACSQQVG